MRSICSGVTPCARNCAQASMLGWMTMPQANGLQVLKLISKCWLGSSVMSDQSFLVETVCTMPGGASSARALAV
jgi:hypothetical protein